MRYLVGLVLMTGACSSPIIPSDIDEDTWRWFPVDGDRTWTFEADDPATPYRLIAHKPEDNEVDEATQRAVYTVTFTYHCLSNTGDCAVDSDGDSEPDIEGQVAWAWSMSQTSTSGAHFYSVADETYAPPVQITPASMTIEEQVVTESGGVTFTSTRTEREVCRATYWNTDAPEDCLTFTIDDGGSGSEVAGAYQALTNFGIVSFTRENDGREFRLQNYEDQID